MHKNIRRRKNAKINKKYVKKHATPIFDRRARQYGSGDRTSAPSTKNGNAQKQKASNWKERRKKTFTPKIINASILIKKHTFLHSAPFLEFHEFQKSDI